MGASIASYALELDPRQWSHLPIGKNYFGVAYADTEADIAADPELQIENAKFELKTIAAKYTRTFGLLDKSVRLDLTQAYLDGKWSGNLQGAQRSRSSSGLSDTFVRFAVNLYGAPPLSDKEFASYKSHNSNETIVGIGLAVRLPTGEYESDKRLNLGQNRFVFRPQLGISHSHGKWSIESTVQAAFHVDNDDFLNGKKLEQDPTYIMVGRFTYTIKPGVRLSLATGYDFVGESKIDGVRQDNKRENFAWGLDFSYPINKHSGFKFVYAQSEKQQAIGADTETAAFSFVLSW